MKTINLIVTGGIAASKSKDLYDLLVKKYNVNLVLSENSQKFVKFDGIDRFDTIFEQEFYDRHTTGDHIKIALESDLSIVYPATYNYIGKIANGLANDIESLIFASSPSPFLLFPSMNFNMYANPILKQNKDKLLGLSKVEWIEPKVGKMASGHVGIGRALEPEEVVDYVENYLMGFEKFNNKKLLLNFGRTRSYIDKVRYITNASSGKMGMSLRDVSKNHFQEIQTVFGDTDFINVENEFNHYADTNPKMLEEMKKYFNQSDIVICSAALYDFEVKNQVDKKIEKRSMDKDNLSIELTGAIDVLYELGKIKTNQYLVGFSLANDFNLDKAFLKMKEKNMDMLVLNLTSALGSDNNEIKILTSKDNKVIDVNASLKNQIAKEILKAIHNEI
ncbi:phosphopantothenoylcysteine decarboxylase / phosphopantothenate---cysteine ligase [Spiroplasma chinense]|uniref:Coenzyme A biosynthesis bifunctional protein CoaBC n=1 Tax=Spiroplasma chinense TaxID=216932 RepID=A0A5B9Y6D9_9MOLU|nr:bifunctional phosphopantothenoylcysteine decarboxylase/phosphopantothenate--cysteine ligase CoaBC [Spiroplasma chinense]QEH61827.1 phosphopantothenoylcysteine decarboxylase / phosphopantothenate---cysteine ligase [Spiroplasma chinense]